MNFIYGKCILSKVPKIFWSKLKPFLFCMGILVGFGYIFGFDNIYIGISLATALLTYKHVNLGISPKPAALCLFFLFLLIGIASWANQLGAWFSIPINFLTVYLLMMCTTISLTQKAYLPLVLCFVFVQGNPVSGEASIRRILGFLFAGALVGSCYYIFHRNQPQKRTFRNVYLESVRFSTRTQFALRMATGLTLAMLIGSLFDCKRPMWIGIVVFSVTQPFLNDTLTRVVHRTFGCVLGIVGFMMLFKYIIDPKYSTLLLMVCGFLSSIPSQYKVQQIFVTVSALGAAMILLEPSQSVVLRVLFLGLGIVIALFCCLVMDKLIAPVYYSLQQKRHSI